MMPHSRLLLHVTLRFLLLITFWLSLLVGCAVAPTRVPEPPTTTPTPGTTLTVETTVTSTPPVDLERVMSPELASIALFPTPTARPTPEAQDFATLTTRAASPQSLALAEALTLSGSLEASDGQFLDGTAYDLYQVELLQGDNLQVEVESTTFDAVLYFMSPRQEVLAYNDDDYRAPGVRAQLEVVVAESGTFYVAVNSFDVAEGTYDLTLVRTAYQPIPDTPIPVGSILTNTLGAGDAPDARGLYHDQWNLVMPEGPVVLTVRSDTFDPRVDVYSADGSGVGRNGDQDPIGQDTNARVLLTPSDTLPSGTPLRVHVGLEGEFAGGGAYEVQVLPYPADATTAATLTVRPVIVKGADGRYGSGATDTLVREAVKRANDVWQQCNIHIAIENDTIETVNIPGLEFTVGVQTTINDTTWTPEENALMTHPTHALPETNVITVYFVRVVDEGIRFGLSYPTSRYSPSRAGMILIGDEGIVAEPFWSTLAHEIGHMLGLNHPALDDGDTDNDTLENLMFTSAGMVDFDTPRIYNELSALQCLTARGAPRYLVADADPLVPAAFLRQDMLLTPTHARGGALTMRDALLSEETPHLVDTWYFYGRAGEAVTLEVTSDAFAPVIVLNGPNEMAPVVAGPETSTSQATLSLQLPVTGDYVVGVTSSQWATGAYQVELHEN